MGTVIDGALGDQIAQQGIFLFSLFFLPAWRSRTDNRTSWSFEASDRDWDGVAWEQSLALVWAEDERKKQRL